MWDKITFNTPPTQFRAFNTPPTQFGSDRVGLEGSDWGWARYNFFVGAIAYLFDIAVIGEFKFNDTENRPHKITEFINKKSMAKSIDPNDTRITSMGSSLRKFINKIISTLRRQPPAQSATSASIRRNSMPSVTVPADKAAEIEARRSRVEAQADQKRAQLASSKAQLQSSPESSLANARAEAEAAAKRTKEAQSKAALDYTLPTQARQLPSNFDAWSAKQIVLDKEIEDVNLQILDIEMSSNPNDPALISLKTQLVDLTKESAEHQKQKQINADMFVAAQATFGSDAYKRMLEENAKINAMPAKEAQQARQQRAARNVAFYDWNAKHEKLSNELRDLSQKILGIQMSNNPKDPALKDLEARYAVLNKQFEEHKKQHPKV